MTNVDDLIDDRVDGEIQSVAWTRTSDGTHYAVVTSIRDESATVGLTTICLDTRDETLRIVADNSMWIPADGDVLDLVVRSLARTHSELTGALNESNGPLRESLLPFDADQIGGFEIDDEYVASTDDGHDWKASEGREERYDVHRRLEESSIENPDRLIRLEPEGKAPWSGEPQRVMRPPEEIGRNYGIEVDDDDHLIILDVDDVDAAAGTLGVLPDTLRSESPHGGEHRFYYSENAVNVFRDRFGVENPHPTWGEIRAGDGYVVGPGSILTDCKHGCCTEDDPGRYQLDDRRIASVDARLLASLLAADREGSR